ncbi:hypothetical protein DSO57_1020487 [Entomophthora muscae]|uniref:Uncharacterized protein n=1 Tax=Entomophthora muscae TaxID=34485 RepID=A0ACC2UNT8_9FUNG|nr:hypothetical protein DSO57_1020487 [Entomophthora muscae]
MEENREGMVCYEAIIKRLHSTMRELKAQLAKVRSEPQEGRCRCNHEQFSAPRMHHDVYAESTTLRQLTSSVYEDNAILSSLGRQSLPPVFVVPLTPEETTCPNCSESSAGTSWQNFFARTQ